MANVSNINKIQTDLIMDHHQLVRLLEMEYTNYICELLKQKNMILHNLQQQFIEQRNKIKETMQNGPIITKNEEKYTNIRVIDTNANTDSMMNDIESVSQNHASLKKTYKKHKCPHCEYSTNKTDHLRDHIRVHTGDKPFVCTFDGCNKRFAQKGNLNLHIKRHLGDKKFKCLYCGKAFIAKSKLKRHMNVHKGSLINEKMTNLTNDLSPENGNNYAQIRVNPIKINLDSAANGSIIPPPPSINDNLNKTCSQKTSSKVSNQESENKKSPQDKSQSKKHKCMHCGEYSTNHSGHLKRHILSCISPHSCPFENCDKEFRQKKKLKAHIHEHIKKGDKMHKCTQCAYSTNLKDNLKKHLRTHSGERPFVCSFDGCNKAFSTKSHLQRHNKVHVGEGPHQCMHCKKRFKDEEKMKRHIGMMHPEKPKTHQCPHCSYSTDIKHSLKVHIMSHTDERPFVCSFDGCNKRFRTNAHLTTHSRTHTGDKPFECVHCKKRFTQKSNLTQHLKKCDK